MSYVTVGFKCRCMATERVITVPPRRRGEAVQTWVALVVQPSIYITHRTLWPECQAVDVEFAKIPVDGGVPMVGGLQLG